MKKRKPRIDPEVRYDAVMEILKKPDTYKNVARRNNMSPSTLWNYCADVDAAIKKVVGLDPNSQPEQAKMLFGSAGGRRQHHDQPEPEEACKQEVKVEDNEIVIRIKISSS